MVERLERTIDDVSERFEPPTEFVVPGESVVAAWLDLARTVTRRAERLALPIAAPPSSPASTSTGCRTCCGRWPVGRRASPVCPDPSTILRGDPTAEPTRSFHDAGHRCGGNRPTRHRRGGRPRVRQRTGASPARTVPGSARSSSASRASSARPCRSPPLRGPLVVAVGLGEPSGVNGRSSASAAAALARAAGTRTSLATSLADLDGGLAPCRRRPGGGRGLRSRCYRFSAFKTETAKPQLERVVLTAGREPADRRRRRQRREGWRWRRPSAWPVTWPTPRPTTSTPSTSPSAPSPSRPSGKLGIEVFDESDMAEMGLGGMLGVNRGSTEPPRLVKLTYTPQDADRHRGPGRQGRDVRLGWHLAQAVGRHARPDEDGHDGRRRGAGHDVAACRC